MKQVGEITKLLKSATSLEKSIRQISRGVDDYDLQRLLKKVDAECIDLLHNLTLAKRLAEGLDKKKKRKKKVRHQK